MAKSIKPPKTGNRPPAASLKGPKGSVGNASKGKTTLPKTGGRPPKNAMT